MRPALCLSSVFDGFAWVEGTREWGVEGTLEAKLERWHEEDGLERRRWADDSMAVRCRGRGRRWIIRKKGGEEDEEMPAISSCFRSACTRSSILTALAPIPFPVDVISDPRP